MDQTTFAVKKLPTFLKVLCILSFIGSSYFIASSLNGLVGPGNDKDGELRPAIHQELLDAINLSLNETLQSFREGSESEELINTWIADINSKLTAYTFRKACTLWALGSLCTLFGAMLMWRRRRLGFHLYAAGNLVIIVATFFVFGLGFTGWMFNMVHLIFGSLFTLLYALNLKHLN